MLHSTPTRAGLVQILLRLPLLWQRQRERVGSADPPALCCNGKGELSSCPQKTLPQLWLQQLRGCVRPPPAASHKAGGQRSAAPPRRRGTLAPSRRGSNHRRESTAWSRRRIQRQSSRRRHERRRERPASTHGSHCAAASARRWTASRRTPWPQSRSSRWGRHPACSSHSRLPMSRLHSDE